MLNMDIDTLPTVSFADLPVASLLVDGQGTLFAANILAQEHLNTSEKRLLHKDIAQFISPRNEISQMLKRTSLGETVSSDMFYTRAGHKPYTLYFSKQYDGFIAVVLIAEGNRLEAEAQSRRHEMAEAISRIALERAHEIKNPLAALRGATQLLSEQVEGDELMIVHHMLSEIDRIKERVDGFLQVGPRANVSMERVNIHALVDGVCQGSNAVKVERTYDPSIPDLLLHEKRFRQAVENLWWNAIEAESDLIIWESRIAHGIVLPKHKGVVMALKITSNGKAIPDHIQGKIFEPYVSAKERGNGLGLSVVQQVMQEHGGKVTVRSESGRTSFTLFLPLRMVKVC